MTTTPTTTSVDRATPAQAGSPAAAARVAIITLGCGRNEVDSDQLAGLLGHQGMEVVDDPERADAVLVNTCTFIEPAKQESIDTVLEVCRLKEEGSARAVLIVGCMAQRYPHELAEAIPEADAIVGFDGYPRLPEILASTLAGTLDARVLGVGEAHPGSRPARVQRQLPLLTTGSVPDAPPSDAPSSGEQTDVAPVATDGALLGLRVLEHTGAPRLLAAQDQLDRLGPDRLGPDLLVRAPASGPPVALRAHDGRPWAYLKIASGCDRVCTFCAIPSFRGRFRSRPMEEILAEAASLAARGARELVLVSENTTSWGKDLPGGRDLQPRLLRGLAAVDGVERIRLMYLQPAELTGALLEAIAAEPKVASYLDLSLQHVSGPVVARMARSGDAERFGALIERARSLDPGVVLRSNFILGFPGETEHDVEVLEGFLEAHRLDWVGLFAFSREDGTPAEHLPDQVPAEVAEERVRRVSSLQERLADEAARAFVGRDLDVIVQAPPDEADAGDPDPDGTGVVVGRSYREAPDTDGEVRLRPAAAGWGAAGPPFPGTSVRATVVASDGVDLVAEIATAAGVGHREAGHPGEDHRG